MLNWFYWSETTTKDIAMTKRADDQRMHEKKRTNISIM